MWERTGEKNLLGNMYSLACVSVCACMRDIDEREGGMRVWRGFRHTVVSVNSFNLVFSFQNLCTYLNDMGISTSSSLQ
jgi:hypothetical protein